MNKKQLTALTGALVIAVMNSQPGLTEDEARTLVGMKLRQAANGIVAAAAGVDEAKAGELLTAAHATVAETIEGKKKAKKAKITKPAK